MCDAALLMRGKALTPPDGSVLDLFYGLLLCLQVWVPDCDYILKAKVDEADVCYLLEFRLGMSRVNVLEESPINLMQLGHGLRTSQDC